MTKHKLTRDFYIPAGAEPIDNEGTDAVIYFYDNRKGQPCMLAFHGRAQKPDLHFRYTSAERRDKRAAEFIASRKSHAEYKGAQAEKRKAPHTLQEGDILYSSWGYDQTNVDFYQVTRIISGRTIELRKIAKETTSAKPPANYVTAIKGAFIGDRFTKRASAGNYVSLTSYAGASQWNGQPAYETSPGWGH